MAKTAFRIIIFIIGIIVINQILSFLLVPHVCYARKVQHDILYSEEPYDLIAFGSSEMFYAFDAPYAGEVLGKKCYNMGTSGTALVGGVYATFRDTMRYQSPKTVIIFLGTDLMYDGTEATMAYVGIEPYLRGITSKLEYFGRSAFFGDVLGRLFPWAVNHSDTLEGVFENVKVKLSKEYRSYDREALPNISLVFEGDGFCAQLPGDENDNVVKYEHFNIDDYTDPATGKIITKEAVFNKDCVTILQKMIQQCKDNGAKVIVAMPPTTRMRMVTVEGYDSYTSQLQDLCDKENVDYVDLNYAKPELYDPQPYEYVDTNHVLIDGARRYTDSICTYMKMKEAGEDTSDLFWSSWDEFVDSVDWESYKGME